jgi:hypothetical protein
MTFAKIVRAALTAAAVVVATVLATSTAVAASPEGAVTIDAAFRGGNIVVEANDGAAVQVAPELRGDNPWFYWYFQATATTPGRVRFVFPEKVAGAVNGGIGLQGPAISTDLGKTWKWMGTEQVDGREFYYDFREKGERIRFAVTIPYLQTELDAFLTRNAGNPQLAKSVLTHSRQGREVELLRIGEPGAGKQPMLVTGRHHAAETIASYVLEGFLQGATSDTPAGRSFREKYVLYAVPFVDKDGVEQGDQGKNRKPHDHNRDYGESSIYPEVQAIKQLDKEVNFEFALDFHCPMLIYPDHQVIYFTGEKELPANNFENVTEFARWIKQGLPATAPVGPLVWLKDVDRRLPTNARYFGIKENVVLAATLEFPFAPPGKATDAASCRRYGEVILRAWVETHFRSAKTEQARE